MQKLSYNKSAKELYAPTGFPAFCAEVERLNDDVSPDAVREAQAAVDAKVDGWLGPNIVDAIGVRHRRQQNGGQCEADGTGYVIVGPKAVEVPAPVVAWPEYSELQKTPAEKRGPKGASVDTIVLHYDVAFTSMDAHATLKKRGLSSHFYVDGDESATVRQCHNPLTRVCYHEETVNDRAVGIEINNPAAPRFADRDADLRGRKRGTETCRINGAQIERLKFFERQVEVTRRLVGALHAAAGIDVSVPRHGDGELKHNRLERPEEASGLLAHYHLDGDKTDPAPLDLGAVVPET